MRARGIPSTAGMDCGCLRFPSPASTTPAFRGVEAVSIGSYVSRFFRRWLYLPCSGNIELRLLAGRSPTAPSAVQSASELEVARSLPRVSHGFQLRASVVKTVPFPPSPRRSSVSLPTPASRYLRFVGSPRARGERLDLHDVGRRRRRVWRVDVLHCRPVRLAGLVDHIWLFDGAMTCLRERTFPNGLLEIIVHLGERYRVVEELGRGCAPRPA